jgi:hypothetical protein
MASACSLSEANVADQNRTAVPRIIAPADTHCLRAINRYVIMVVMLTSMSCLRFRSDNRARTGTRQGPRSQSDWSRQDLPRQRRTSAAYNRTFGGTTPAMRGTAAE